MIHELKCWPTAFELIRLGVKTFEVRHESGRTFNAGDVLRLREFDPSRGYTGRAQDVHVTYLLRLRETPGEWRIQGSPTVMAIKRIGDGAP